MRALSRTELQAFFDYADDQVVTARERGRKGWVTAFRDATLFKVCYGWGLRRREAAMLDLVDFGRNPNATQFGELGACYVRYGKALKGSPPRRRTVWTVWDWTVEALREYLQEVRPLFAVGKRQLLWPTERGARIAPRDITRPLRRLPRRVKPGPGPAPALPAPLLHHASDRGWRRPVLRAVPGRARLGLHDRALHQRRLGLHEQRPTRRADPAARRHHERRPSVTRSIGYRWHLRERMAQAGNFSTTELAPHLAERGITLSTSQVHRLVTGIPERLSLPVLAATWKQIGQAL